MNTTNLEFKKRNFKDLLKNNLVSVILFIIIASVVAVIAGNVIVEEGDIELEDLEFNSINGSHIYLQDGTYESHIYQNGQYYNRVNLTGKAILTLTGLPFCSPGDHLGIKFIILSASSSQPPPTLLSMATFEKLPSSSTTNPT